MVRGVGTSFFEALSFGGVAGCDGPFLVFPGLGGGKGSDKAVYGSSVGSSCVGIVLVSAGTKSGTDEIMKRAGNLT